MLKKCMAKCMLSGVLFCSFFLYSSSAFSGESVNDKKPRVLMVYVDGLRPDTVDEMVDKNQLPTIRELFYEKGVRFNHFFTVFPSNTVISNAVLMTGRSPGATGIKSQAFFERFQADKTRWYQSFLPWTKKDYPHQINLLANPHITPKLLKSSDVRAIYDYLGEGYHPALVPINPYPTPMAWPHVAGNVVENAWEVTENAAENFDKVNGEYALNYMTTDTKAQVFLVWFPSLDKDQHLHATGQFGEEARQRMIDVDVWLRKIFNILSKRYPNLNVMLFSDHGAMGGEGVANQQYYLARDFFYKKLKMNVLGPDYSVTYPGTNSDAYAYIDNMGRGQAKIYLPVGDSTTTNWTRPNSYYELTHYGRGPNRKKVDLIEALATESLAERNAFPAVTQSYPMDLIFVKINPKLIYVRSTTHGEALIRSEEKEGVKRYQYVPIRGFSASAENEIHFEEIASDDAFGYLADSNFAEGKGSDFIKMYRTSKEWLHATYKTNYPDGVPAIANFFAWDENLKHRAPAQDPDIVLSAMPGWNFRIENIECADHGFIARESMLATLMFHGPKLKKGKVIENPYRMDQILPTVFKLIDYRKKTNFDEENIEEVYAD